MLVISLTTIPPRFAQLPQVLAALLAQGADVVALVVPRAYARFAPVELPVLPAGVRVLRTETDLGPAGKLLATAGAFPGADILYCDDDWLYAPGWAQAFSGEHPGRVVAASAWPVERIGRRGGTIAQGFAGVRVAADVARAIPPPPPEAWAVDDIWLSGWFAGLGLEVVPAPRARGLCSPLRSPGALQSNTARDAANRATAARLHRDLKIWPSRSR